MAIRLAFAFGFLLGSCTGSAVDLDAPIDSDCHDLSLIQVGLTLSNNKADQSKPTQSTGSNIENLLDTAAKTHAAKASSRLSALRLVGDKLKTRPGLKEGQADEVTFGILIKKWYGIDLAAGTFAVDAIVTLKWSDNRTEKLLPDDTDSVRLSQEDAKDNMWLPDISVTNAAHDGLDVISSSVLINSGGKVMKVERVLLTLKEAWQTRDFPFDTQNASVKVASKVYMRDELKLVPSQDASLWGIDKDGEEVFGNSIWNFKGSQLTQIIDDDGELKKSRGVLTITVKRGISQYISTIFIPSVVLLFMTWSAFWLPLGGPYVMPRIAVNAFALLCQVSVSQTANNMVPATGKAAWMTEYLELCVELQFVLTLVNVLLISIEHKKKGPALAETLNANMIKSYPLSTAFNIACLCVGYFQLSRLLLVATLVGYLSYLSLSYMYYEEEDPAPAK